MIEYQHQIIVLFSFYFQLVMHEFLLILADNYIRLDLFSCSKEQPISNALFTESNTALNIELQILLVNRFITKWKAVHYQLQLWLAVFIR